MTVDLDRSSANNARTTYSPGDDSRVRERNLTNNLAWLKRFAISLLKQVPDKRSVAMRRRHCGWNENYLTQVLFGSAS